MKKIFALIIIGMMLLMNVSISAKDKLIQEFNDSVKDVVEQVADESIAEQVQPYIESFIENRGIEAKDIKDISQIDFNELPKEINIENVGDHNLAIYEVDYKDSSKGNKENKIFVVTYSVGELKSQGDIILAQDKRQFLNFGFSGESTDSRFLNTAVGVEGSLERGYVMMRSGSITGMSTNLEIVNPGEKVEIIIYKNGKEIGFRNSFDADSAGVKEDYDVQAKDTVKFDKGDIISVYLKSGESDKTVWKDVITLLEITTID